MKFFIALFALAAVALAEPEADPAVYYRGLGFGYTPYAHHTYAHAAYTPHALGYNAYYNNYLGFNNYLGYNNFHNRFGYARLFKRDAEADPAIFYNGLYNGYTYGSAPLAYNHAYTTPYAYHHGFYNHHLPYTYGHAIAAPTHVTQVSQGGVSSTAAVHSGVRAFGGYANAGNYVANSAGVVHVAKREAEADPEAYYAGLGYHYSAPYATSYAHHYTAPYSFGYRAYSPYNFYNGFYNRGYLGGRYFF